MACRFQAILALVLAISPLVEAAATATTLREQCSQLIAQTIRKPYGWALPVEQALQNSAPRGSSLVDIEQTASAALVLELASRDLADPQLGQAARQLARGMLACQQSTGRFPSTGVFGTAAAARDTADEQLERGPTCAAVSTLLVLLEGNKSDEALRRGALRGTQWLVRQQTRTGAWPVFYYGPSDSQPLRLNRLDRPDFRDATLTLIDTADALGDLAARNGAARSIELLTRLQIDDSVSAKGLWRSVYDLASVASEIPQDRAGAVDVLACRYALQTLLAGHLIARDQLAGPAMHKAAASLVPLKYEDGLWTRLYPLSRGEIGAVKGSSPRQLDVFAPAHASGEDLHETSTFSLPQLLQTITLLKQHDQDISHFCRLFSARQQLALLLTGLSDELLSGTWPATPQEGRQWLEKAGRGLQISPAMLDTPQGRIYANLFQLRVERLAAEAGAGK